MCDENGAPIGMQYRTSSYAEDVFDTFYFEKNLQGDIVAVYNSSGTKLVTYKYDAWGNHTTAYSNGGNTTGAQYNPFRYRGYYYDSDLGLYYLNSRYYDANTSRFLNADGQLNGGLLGYNQFAYCLNNPVIYADYFGEFPWLIVVALVAVVISLTSCETSEPEWRPAGAHDTFEEALEAGLNEVFQITATKHEEWARYVFEEGGYYFYRRGRNELKSDGSDSVYYEIDPYPNETLLAIFHSHTNIETGEENSFSDPDYRKMSDHGVDSYMVDTEGNVFMLPHDANYYTEAVRIHDITIHIMD